MADKLLYGEYIKEYDEKNNLIYYQDYSGFIKKMEYDNKNNIVHEKHEVINDGYEFWKKYDENNNMIYFKTTYNVEQWFKYDKFNSRTNITKQEFKQIERTKLYLNNKKINRFELMDI